MADDSNPEVSQGSTHSVETTPIAIPEPVFDFEAAADRAIQLDDNPLVDGDKTVISGTDGNPLLPTIRAGSPQEIAAQLLGQKLGHFNLDQFIGGGGMGAVFRAHDQQLDRTVAIKVLSKGHGEEEVVKRFRIEAQSAARLDHENIARVFYVGEDRGWDYIVFEYIDGQNLRDLVQQNGPLSMEEAVQAALQIAAALEHASQRDVVHRDIKPSNVLVTPTGQVKLVDMGLARVHDVERKGDLTESGVTLGTFDYISPEQARDPRHADVRSDLYSLGCTLYYILTGQPPFPDGNFFQKLLKHQNERHADPRLLRPDLDEDFVGILDKLLAKQPSRRFQTPTELIAALFELADKLGIEASTARIAASLKPLARRREWLRAFTWLGPLAMLLVGIWGYDAFLRSKSSTNWRPTPVLRTVSRDLEQPASESTTTEAVSDSEATYAGRPRGPLVTTSRNPRVHGPYIALPNERYGDIDFIGRNIAAGMQQRVVPPEPLRKDDSNVSPSDAGSRPLAANTVLVTDDHNLLALGADRGYYATLQDACLAASDRSGLQFIEIGARELEVKGFLQVQSPQLTIRSVNPEGTLLRFRAAPDSFTSNSSAISQLGGVVRWERIQFEWTPSPSMNRGSAMMELRDTQRTAFKECILTARTNESTIPTIDAPTFLRGESTVEGGMMTPDMMIDSPIEMVIDLSDTIARGDVTLLKASPNAPLSLRWSEGLFTSTKRLAEFRGAFRKPPAQSKAKIELTRVTVQSLEGLVRTSTSVDESHSVPTHLSLRDSFISVPPGVALVENYRQDAQTQFESAPLLVDGEGNTYFGADLLWTSKSGAGKTETALRLKGLVQIWYRESAPNMTASLLSPRIGVVVPCESATPEDFLSSEEGFQQGGFTPERLPVPIE